MPNKSRARILFFFSGRRSLNASGSTTLAEDFSGVAFTLYVSSDPLGEYDTFVEVSDADNISSLSGDEVTITGLDYETHTSHSLRYSASSSTNPGLPTLYLDVVITVTDVDEALGFLLEDSSGVILLESGDTLLRE